MHYVAETVESQPDLNIAGTYTFIQVYQGLKVEVRDGVISLIDQESDGEQID